MTLGSGRGEESLAAFLSGPWLIDPVGIFVFVFFFKLVCLLKVRFLFIAWQLIPNETQSYADFSIARVRKSKGSQANEFVIQA